MRESTGERRAGRVEEELGADGIGDGDQLLRGELGCADVCCARRKDNSSALVGKGRKGRKPSAMRAARRRGAALTCGKHHRRVDVELAGDAHRHGRRRADVEHRATRARDEGADGGKALAESGR
eukprot:3091445-Prymnesium_polylepis.1